MEVIPIHATSPAIAPHPDAQTLLPRIQSLYDQGLYLQAYHLAAPLGELPTWQGPEARVLAGRLANNLGGSRLGRVLHRRALRESPDYPLAVYFGARAILSTRGPWPAWQFCRARGELAGAPDELLAEWLAMQATILVLFRDFARGERLMAKALELSPQDPWLWVEQSFAFEQSDQREAALEAARHSLLLQPLFRPAVQSAAHLLVQLNRDQEALDLLTEASTRLESGELLAQLAGLQSELGEHQAARATLEQIAKFMPLVRYSKKYDQWLSARRSDLAYDCGDYPEAIRLARESKNPFHQKVAEHLEQNAQTGKRVQLQVGFVHQDHVTCAPATLTSLAGFWGQAALHQEVAQSICYDGTPGHRERNWAEEHGFAAREFRVTLDSAVALVDRGVPFTLTTIGPGNAHLQAVIGYDTRRGSLLVRDPGDRHVAEFLGAEMIEHFRSTGPRGMAMVPREKAQLLEGLDLPEAELYDLSHQLDQALEEHQRDAAQALYQKMRDAAPNHRLTLHCRGKLAHYDSDTLAVLQNTERLLAEFPKDPNLQLMQLRCLRELGRREQRLAQLEAICRERPDPLFWQQLAIELLDDSRQHARAAWQIRRAMLWRPQDGTNYHLLADLQWSTPAREDAFELYRIAACLDDKHEGRAQAYFAAARNLRRTEEALEFLQDRYERFGGLSCWPARTLCGAYEQLDRAGEALDLARAALLRRPDDAELALFAADLFARYGEHQDADRELARAQPLAHRTSLLRTAANIAGYRGDPAAALDSWRQVLSAEPLARDANNMVVRLVGDLLGEEAAIAQARAAVDRFPHNLALRALLIERLGPFDPVAAEAVIRETAEIDPIDPWTRRELAIALLRLNRLDDALLEADLANQLDPSSPVVELIRGRIFLQRGDVSAARGAARSALVRNVDYEPGLDLLMQLCQTKSQRQEALRFMIEQLVAQVIFGDGLLTFLDYAQRSLEPPEVLRILRDAHAARPDLWHAHAALIRFLLETGESDEALSLAKQAVERFPLLPRMWVELAAVHRRREDDEGELSALQQAQSINPSWGETCRLLAEAYVRRNDLTRAQTELARAAAADPRDVRTLAKLAELEWKQEQKDQAVLTLRRTVRLEPGFDYAWNLLRDYCGQLNRRDDALAEARQLAQLRPREARSWFRLADMLDQPAERDEALAALDKTLDLNPRLTDAYNMRAFYLSEAQRYDEALAACSPPIFGGDLPLDLRSRAAFIHGQAGRIDEAIAAMKGVVTDDPDYYWAWNRLADWYGDRGNNEDYLAASEQLVRLAPQRAPSFGYRGDARVRLKQTAEAIADFEHALSLDPSYTYATFYLVDLHLEAKEPDRAQKVFDEFGSHFEPAWRESVAARIAIAQRDAEAVARRLTILSQIQPADHGPLQQALKAAAKADYNISATAALRTALTDPKVSEGVVVPYVEYLGATNDGGPIPALLDSLRNRPELWHTTASKWLTTVANEQKFNGFDEVFARYRRELAADDATWIAVGHVLLNREKPTLVLDWMSDWRSREKLEGRGLFPLVLAHWELNQPEKSTEIARASLDLPGPPSWRNRLWLTACELVAGKTDTARELLASVPRDVQHEYYQKLYDALTLVAAALSPQDKQPLSTTLGRLRIFLNLGDKEPDRASRHLYRRLAVRIAWDKGHYLRAACLRYFG